MTELPKHAKGLLKEMTRPYKRRITLFFVLSFIGIISWAASPFAIRDLINELSKNQGIHAYAWWLVGIFVVLRLFDEWFWRIAEAIMKEIKNPMLERMRTILFDYAIQKPYNFFVNSSSGQLGHWINQTVKTLDETIDTTIWSVWPRVTSIILSAVFLIFAHWLLALIFITWAAGLMLFTVRRGRTFTKLVEKESDAKSAATGQVVDSLSNHLSVRVFNARGRESISLRKRQELILKRQAISWNFSIRTNMVKGHSVALVAGVSLAAVLWLFGRHQLTVGDVALFIAYFTDATSSIWELSWQMDTYYRSFGAINNAIAGLRAGGEERIVRDLRPLPETASIELKDLTFSYPDQTDLTVLKNVNLQIKAGERIGLVGHSGAGKTTLVGLLLGFYELTGGEFKIGEAVVSELSPDQLRELISFVPQDTNLFNRTIAENIAYARPEATKDEIHQAAADAQALDFIEKLPLGFDTMIGERGVKLSGGQRQRIAIARALLKNAPILLLDEATSALDSVSEQAIQKAFNIAMKDRTAVVVAHRLSTLRHLDRIVVFEGGTIVEQGSHDDLVDGGGVYADLWRRQKDGFIAE